MPDTPLPDLLRSAGPLMIDALPHARAIGMRVVDMDWGACVASIPYAEHLIGDPDTGVIHGGVVTTLLDNASGLAAFLAGDTPMQVATLDLRIDYNRPAVPGKAIYARATCYKVTRSVAFVRGTAWESDEQDPVATSVGTFMLTEVPEYMMQLASQIGSQQ